MNVSKTDTTPNMHPSAIFNTTTTSTPSAHHLNSSISLFATLPGAAGSLAAQRANISTFTTFGTSGLENPYSPSSPQAIPTSSTGAETSDCSDTTTPLYWNSTLWPISKAPFSTSNTGSRSSKTPLTPSTTPSSASPLVGNSTRLNLSSTSFTATFMNSSREPNRPISGPTTTRSGPKPILTAPQPGQTSDVSVGYGSTEVPSVNIEPPSGPQTDPPSVASWSMKTPPRPPMPSTLLTAHVPGFPTTTSLTSTPSDYSDITVGGSSESQIAGIAAAGAVIVLAFLGLALYLLRKKLTEKKNDDDASMVGDSNMQNMPWGFYNAIRLVRGNSNERTSWDPGSNVQLADEA